MKKSLILLLITTLIAGCGFTGGSKNPSSVIKHMGDSTVALVFQRTREEVIPFCTAVWVDKDLILTAHHCVQAVANEMAESEDVDADVDGVKIHYIVGKEVVGLGEEPTAMHLSHVVADDPGHDLALLRADGDAVPEHEVARLANSSPAVGEKLRFVGHPRGLYWTLVDGNVAAYRKEVPGHDGFGPYLQVSAPVFFGNSGGGAFDEDGNLVGIASFIVRVPNAAFYIHLDNIAKFLKEYNSPENKK